MSQKSKGCNAERELIHLFWSTQTWAACRVAGSGSMHYPAPDIIAATQKRNMAIECKITKTDYQYFDKQEISELKHFATLTNIEPIIALKFSKQPWRFITPEQLKETNKNYVITREDAQRVGKLFIELIANQTKDEANKNPS